MGEGRPSSSAKRSPGPFPRTPPRDPARRPLRQCPIQPGPGPRPGAGRAAPLGEPPRPAAGRRVLGTRGQLRCQRLSPRGRRACRRRGETGRKGGGGGVVCFFLTTAAFPAEFYLSLTCALPRVVRQGPRPAPPGPHGPPWRCPSRRRRRCCPSPAEPRTGCGTAPPRPAAQWGRGSSAPRSGAANGKRRAGARPPAAAGAT